MKVLRNLLVAVALQAGASACVVHSSRPVREPPAPRVERYSVRPGYVWVEGRWLWRDEAWQWQPGHWTRARSGYAYQQGRWERGPDGELRWRPGRWVEPPSRHSHEVEVHRSPRVRVRRHVHD
jgi:hypothetical protein